MEKILIKAFRNVVETARSKKISLRGAAYQIAIERVARAQKLRGTEGDSIRRLHRWKNLI